MPCLLITGGTGQVGRELARLPWPTGFELHFPTREQLNLTVPDSIAAMLSSRNWAGVINCAAYTAVDRAESEPAAAFLVNAQGAAWLAEATGRAGVPLVHVSTDYVFDGEKSGAYEEDDPVAPLCAYGASKLAGELAVRAGNSRSVIIRTAWLLSAHGTNFLKTMLRIVSKGEAIRVVDDQTGNPTAASDLAIVLRAVMLRLIEDSQSPVGTYHFVNAGEATWYELARATFECAAAAGVPTAGVVPITTAQYPTAARRPVNSCLSTAKIGVDYAITARHWRHAISEIVTELVEANVESVRT